MSNIHSAIMGIEAFVPEYILTNATLSRMVDTSDEWIMSRVGIKERHILRGRGKGNSEMGAAAVRKLLEKTNPDPAEIDMLLCCTVTPDMLFPATANIICDKAGIKNAWGYDINAGCSGFVFAYATVDAFIRTGRAKKAILVAGEKMSAITNYKDRATCPLFGDGAGVALVEPTTEDVGLIDAILRTDGSGFPHLHMKAGGSVHPASYETIDNRWHYVYQEGQVVFKNAVADMADVSEEIMKRNNLVADELAWFIPHQANLRIIDAVARRMGVGKEKVMINIEKYANTSAATIPICLWELEPTLKKGDKLVLSTFGAGFTYGSMYLKWGYDGKK